MKYIKISSVLLVLGVHTAQAEESTRISILRLPSRDADSVREELNDPAKGKRLETMDGVLNRSGVSVLAHFHEVNPWRGPSIDRAFPQGEEFYNYEDPHPFVSLNIEGDQTASTLQEKLAAYITFPTSKKGYWFLQDVGSSINLESNKWLERSSWSDGKETVMLWQFPVVEKKTMAPVGDIESSIDFKLEMRWLRASAVDCDTLGKATQETREKASLWIAARAHLQREGMFRMKKRTGQKVVWGFSNGMITGRGDDLTMEDEEFYVVNKFSQVQEPIKVNWEISFKKQGEEKISTYGMAAVVATGVWDFQMVKDVPGVNVVVYRFSNEENELGK